MNFSSRCQDLSLLSTLKMGGLAANFYQPSTIEDYIKLCSHFSVNSIDYIVVGNLSNTLFRSGIIQTPIVSTKNLNNITLDNSILRCEPGVQMPYLARYLSKLGFSHFNPLSGIPCTIAGAVVNNAGSYGLSIDSLVKDITLINSRGALEVINAHDIGFSWRNSSLKERKHSLCITSCTFDLAKFLPNLDLHHQPLIDLDLYLFTRSDEQRCIYPNLGSTFALADLPFDLYSDNLFLQKIISLTRKLILMLPFNSIWKRIILRFFARLTVLIFVRFKFSFFKRLAFHNPNVFVKIGQSDTPEKFMEDLDFLMSKCSMLTPEINIYTRVK